MTTTTNTCSTLSTVVLSNDVIDVINDVMNSTIGITGIESTVDYKDFMTRYNIVNLTNGSGITTASLKLTPVIDLDVFDKFQFTSKKKNIDMNISSIDLEFFLLVKSYCHIEHDETIIDLMNQLKVLLALKSGEKQG